MWVEHMIIFNNVQEGKENRDNLLLVCDKLVPLMTPKEIVAVMKVMDKVFKRLEREGKTKD